MPSFLEDETVITYDDTSSNKATGQVWGNILGAAGAGGALSGLGDVICSIKGNCQPKSVNYVQANNGGRNNLMMWIIIGVVAVALFMFLKK